MAVTQISQIQIRSGFSEDIGTLALGEFAWAIDTQRLYIGNGTAFDGAPVGGNTEIVTTANAFDTGITGGGTGGGGGGTGTVDLSGTYVYKGLQGGYEVVSGTDIDNPTIRTIQDKIDDFVNVRDFGAIGNGIADDTDSIQKCIDETYSRRFGTTPFITRRGIDFSGGKYKITRELRIPPYATLRGDGLRSVTISQTGAFGVARFTTTLGLRPTDINTLPFTYPSSVAISGITFETATDNSVFTIDSATDCVFTNVAFAGSRTQPNTVGNGACVNINSSVVATTKITFRSCNFSGLGRAANISKVTKTQSILFSDCKFSNLWVGINANTGNIKVSDCLFEDIGSYGIYGALNASGIVSASNTYLNVGNNFVDEENPTAEVIVFQADNNYSIADVFARSVAASKVFARVQTNGYAVISTAIDDAFRLGNSYQTPGKKYTLADGATSSMAVPYVKYGIINYTVTRNAESRTGIIKFSSGANSTIVYDDEYTETVNLGVTLLPQYDSVTEVFSLGAELTTNGHAATLVFDIKTLH